MEEKMRERLETILQRCVYLEKMMELPNVASDFQRYKMYAKEHSNLEEIANVYLEYKKAVQTAIDAQELSHDSDPDVAEMAKEEYSSAVAKQDELEKKIQIMLLPKDPNDEKNIIMEIRGAAGGDEGNIFAGDLLRMYTKYCDLKGWHYEMIDANESAAGGFAFVSIMIKGKRVYSELKYESGAHRVQRVPRTEASGRIHTSTATVLIMPEADEVDVQINPSDLQIDTYRASGAGGQHINKTDSAVRITHIPTGTVVTCQDGRSQIENREKAMAVLRTRIYDKIREDNEMQRGAERRSKLGTGDRSEKIRTYNYPQNRVTDHRIGFTIQQLDRVMEGELGSIINALINEDQRRKLLGQEL